MANSLDTISNRESLQDSGDDTFVQTFVSCNFRSGEQFDKLILLLTHLIPPHSSPHQPFHTQPDKDTPDHTATENTDPSH